MNILLTGLKDMPASKYAGYLEYVLDRLGTVKTIGSFYVENAEKPSPTFEWWGEQGYALEQHSIWISLWGNLSAKMAVEAALDKVEYDEIICFSLTGEASEVIKQALIKGIKVRKYGAPIPPRAI